jgi:hypothetical protein
VVVDGSSALTHPEAYQLSSKLTPSVKELPTRNAVGSWKSPLVIRSARAGAAVDATSSVTSVTSPNAKSDFAGAEDARALLDSLRTP